MHKSRPDSAATDVGEFLTDLDGGSFEVIASQALSEVAAAVVDHGKKGKVTITFDIEQVKGTHQVRVTHGCKFVKPTGMGKASEEMSSGTVLHVGKYGALSLSQVPLFEKNRQGELTN